MNQELKEIIEQKIKELFLDNTPYEVEGGVWYEQDVEIIHGQNCIGNLYIKYMLEVETTAQEGDTHHGATERWEECEVTDVIIDELILTDPDGDNIGLTFDIRRLQIDAKRWANGVG